MYLTYKELRILELELRVSTADYDKEKMAALKAAHKKINAELDKREAHNKNLKTDYDKKI